MSGNLLRGGAVIIGAFLGKQFMDSKTGKSSYTNLEDIIIYGGGAVILGAFALKTMKDKNVFGASSAAAYSGGGYAALPMNEGGGFYKTITNTPNMDSHATQYSMGPESTGLDQSAPSTLLRSDYVEPSTPVQVDPFNGYVPRLPVNAVRPMIPVISGIGANAMVLSAEGSQGRSRSGDNQANSTDDSGVLNGRFGRPALVPGTNEGYLDMATGMTKTMDEWRRSYSLSRMSDTLVRGMPMSGGIPVMLRRV